MSVNKEKKTIYFLLTVEPLTFISSLREFLTSTKIMIKKTKSSATFKINNNWRLNSFNAIKLLSINVKNVKKPTDNVIINIKHTKIFFW